MAGKQYYIEAVPEEGAPNQGPLLYPGCLVSILIVVGLAATITAGVQSEKSDVNPNTVWSIYGVGIGFLLILMVFTIYRNTSLKRRLGTGIDVLRKILKFEISTEFYDVSLTMFLRPDRLQQGSVTTMLLFAQNARSRARRIKFRFPKSYDLGSLSGRQLYLLVKPGQTVVYRESFQVPPDARPNSGKQIVCTFRVLDPLGMGIRLLPRSRNSMLLRTRGLSFPMEIREGVDPEFRAVPELPDPQYLSIYTHPMPEPRFELLRLLTQTGPMEGIPVPPELPKH